MAIGLDDALLGWLVASVGDVVARRLRGGPAKQAMRQVVEHAVKATVVEVAGHLDRHKAEHLRSSLLIRDATPSIGGVPVASEAELRHALRAWTAALDHPEFGEPGYLSGLGVDPQLLAETLTSQIAVGIRRNGRGGGALDGLAAWLWRDGLTDHLARIETKLDAGAAEPVGGGLPGGTPAFTGRQQALAELAERVRAHDPAGTVVAIHAVDGMAGVGKTELALRAAHQHKHRYPDGQYFINLHGYTEGIPPMRPEMALEELLRQAGVPGQAIPADLAGRQARWQALTATRRALVLLDNALDVDQVRPLLPNSAGCLVLVTSRTRLRGLPDARALPLDVLPPAEAVELFTRLVNIGRQLDSEAVSRVVDLVGWLPVAVRAVAGQVDDSYSEVELVVELAEARTGAGLVDQASPLGPGVRAAFETSLRRLDPGHQRAFRVLGVHPGPTVGVPQFAALAGLPTASARSMLRGLADRNLVTPANDRIGHRRYELHDLLRELARQQAESHLSVQDRSAAIARLTSWYATAMSAVKRLWDHSEPALERAIDGLSMDGLSEARAWVFAEQGNLLAFAELAADADAAHVCFEAALRFYMLDHYATARMLYQSAADVYGRTENRRGEADALWGLGQVAVNAADYPGADKHFRDALAITRQIAYRHREADALIGLGHLGMLTGNVAAADTHFRDALAISRQIAHRHGEAAALNGLGGAAHAAGDYPSAGRHYEEALAISRQIGHQTGQAQAQFGLGLVAMAAADYSAADGCFREASAIWGEIGHRGGDADALIGLGEVAAAAGNLTDAEAHLRDALAICRQIGHRLGEADALTALGQAAKADGRADDARERWHDALGIYVDIGSPLAESVRELLQRDGRG